MAMHGCEAFSLPVTSDMFSQMPMLYTNVGLVQVINSLISLKQDLEYETLVNFATPVGRLFHYS